MFWCMDGVALNEMHAEHWANTAQHGNTFVESGAIGEPRWTNLLLCGNDGGYGNAAVESQSK
jgi:hypothetical protein